MEKLLDELENKKKIKSTFTNISFVFSLLTLLQLCFLFFHILTTFYGYEKKNNFQIYLIYSIVLSTALGSIFTFLAFLKEEKRKLLRWFSLIINLGLIAMLVLFFYLGTKFEKLH